MKQQNRNEYRRNNWSVHLKDEVILLWVVCDSGGFKRAQKSGFKPDSRDGLLAWADRVMAGKPDDDSGLRWIHASAL